MNRKTLDEAEARMKALETEIKTLEAKLYDLQDQWRVASLEVYDARRTMYGSASFPVPPGHED